MHSRDKNKKKTEIMESRTRKKTKNFSSLSMTYDAHNQDDNAQALDIYQTTEKDVTEATLIILFRRATTAECVCEQSLLLQPSLSIWNVISLKKKKGRHNRMNEASAEKRCRVIKGLLLLIKNLLQKEAKRRKKGGQRFNQQRLLDSKMADRPTDVNGRRGHYRHVPSP